jgi:hypothetical protein
LGGNLVLVDGPSKNLHTFWDDLLGTGDTQNFMKAVAAAGTLPAPDPSLVADDNENDWAKESAALAQSDVYVAPVGPGPGPFNLDGAYTTNAQKIARQRVSLAGARLANLLKKALNCGDQTCAN